MIEQYKLVWKSFYSVFRPNESLQFFLHKTDLIANFWNLIFRAVNVSQINTCLENISFKFCQLILRKLQFQNISKCKMSKCNRNSYQIIALVRQFSCICLQIDVMLHFLNRSTIHCHSMLSPKIKGVDGVDLLNSWPDKRRVGRLYFSVEVLRRIHI